MTNFFGHSLHTTTLLDKLSGFMKADYIYETAFPLIRSQSVTYSEGDTEDTLEEKKAFVSLSVFDNSQINFPFKFQRGWKTSNYVRITSRLYINVWQGAWQKKKQPIETVLITYCDQSIPSPVSMPPDSGANTLSFKAKNSFRNCCPNCTNNCSSSTSTT
jgi:hypothetical protein